MDLRAALSGPINQREHDRQLEAMRRKIDAARSGIAAVKRRLDPNDLKYGFSDNAKSALMLEKMLDACEFEVERRGKP